MFTTNNNKITNNSGRADKIVKFLFKFKKSKNIKIFLKTKKFTKTKYFK